MSKLDPDVLPEANMILDGYHEIDDLTKCPVCNGNIIHAIIKGYGMYPKGGYRNLLNINNLIGAAIECPVCFENLVHHITEDFKKSIDEFIILKKRKYEHD